MTVEEVCAKVDAILIEEFELDADLVAPTARLREDLELDSLDGVDLVVALENEFGVRIEDEVMVEMKTIRDIHTYVADHAKKQ